MQRPRSAQWTTLFGVSVLLSLTTTTVASAAASGAVGVVVSRSNPESQDPPTALLDGDLLLSWETLPDPAIDVPTRRGDIADAADWLWLVREEIPRGGLRLHGLRHGQPLAVEVHIGELAIEVIPRMDAPTLERYLSWAARIGARGPRTTAAALPRGVLDAALAEWQALATEASAAGNWALAWWLWQETAEARSRAREWDAALAAQEAALQAIDQGAISGAKGTLLRTEALLGRALILARQGVAPAAIAAFDQAQTAAEESLGESLTLVRVLQELGQFHAARGQLPEALPILEHSLAVAQALAPDSVPVGVSQRMLAALQSRKGELEAAEASADRAVAIHERSAPNSLTLADSLGSRGTIAAQRGQLATATALMERAATIQERLAPGSLTLARTLNNLGIQAWIRGDLATAEAYYTRSLALKEAASPDDPSLASSLNNLGVVASQRGDLIAAQAAFEQALSIWEARAPNSPEMGSSLANLATIAEQRGDLDRARYFAERGLRYYRERAPGSDEVAGALANIGTSEMVRGHFDGAAQAFEEALAIAREAVPDGPRVARILHNQGSLASRQGDLSAAETLYLRALELKQRHAPDSLDVAETVTGLGDVAVRRGDHKSAEALFRRALALVERWAPDGADAVELWAELGQIERTRGHLDAAAHSYTTAIAALERQIGRLGGNQDLRSRFRAKYLGIYQSLIEVLVELGRPAEAFHTLERSRARGLLAMLAERDLVLARDLPAELEAERRETSVGRDRVLSQLLQASAAGDAAKAEALQARLRDIERRQGELRDHILQASPRVADLEYPRPLDLTEARTALDPGTVLLSYSVHRDRTVLFVLPASGELRVITIPEREEALRALIDQFRAALRFSRSDAHGLAAFIDAGAELDRLLLQPAEAEIASAERLLVVADGSLHLLPFAAIPTTGAGDNSAAPQLLITRKPIHFAPSATVYHQLRRTRRGEASSTLVAFGDPQYTKAEVMRPEPAHRRDQTVRLVTDSWQRFEPLPGTRAEVLGIQHTWGEGASVYVGEEATEERAKELSPQPRVLHFAVHGYLDEDFPLSSGLALTLRRQPEPGQDNGLLQAWEIFEQIRLDADLVTLSACDTGRGREVRGEGLIGLTRAFQYAGARTVLASLWSVPDDTTTVLMQRFYHHLRSGQTKDEALRQAQLDLLLGRVVVTRPGGSVVDASTPHAWAAFGLNGDWR